ncbi:MAG: DUF6114 domain-containing protein [Candidatus Thermoplasmatota archaeon]|jgi:hypothetical protein|nr:DUF6114 domain-containing protein [Candidatus Thermoplasmatota archaeon]
MESKTFLKFAEFFSIFRNNRDSAAITFAGGIVTLSVALIELNLIVTSGGVSFSQYVEFFLTAVLPAVIELSCAMAMWFYMRRSGILGLITMITAFISFAGTEGGLFVGFFLAFFGGIMSALFRVTKN